MAWTYAIMSQSLGLAMNNAVAAEKNMQIIANSATSVVCARMLSDMASWPRMLGIGMKYLLARRGPLTVSAGYAGAFARTRPELTRPDVQFYLINFSAPKAGAKFGLSTSACSFSRRAPSRSPSHTFATPST